MKNKSLFTKVLKIIFGLIVVLLVVVGILWRNEISSVMSIKEIMPQDLSHKDGYVYKANIKGDYYFDKFIEQGGVKSDQELIEFVTKNLTKGLMKINIEQKDIACSSYVAETANKENIFARNYDMKMTNTAIIHTNPGKDRYASISTVDLNFLSIDPQKGVKSLSDKIKLLASVYTPLDGMNEKGLTVGVYMTYQGPGKEKGIPTNQNTEKPDITTTTLLRLFLDKCETVEEAIEMAKKYDMHESAGTSFHYMVADAKGDSAILEWVGDKDSTDTDPSKRKLVVIRKSDNKKNYQVVTNFIVKDGYYDESDKKYGLDRYELISKILEDKKGIVSNEQEAMDILRSVGRRNWNNDDENSITTHSVIYNMSKKTVYWIGNEHFDDEKYVYKYEFK